MKKRAIPPTRVMRLIWFGFVLSGVMLIYVEVTIPVRATNTAEPAVELAIAIQALLDVLLGFFARRFLARFARPLPGGNVGSVAINRWFSGNLVSLALIYSCNLFAFALHMLRARPRLVEFLFGVGMISLLLWRPGTPPIPKAGDLPQR